MRPRSWHRYQTSVRHPSLPNNSLGLTKRDYEGAMSTLCAGCGHDSVTAALVQALWELELPPHRAAKMSGIGCSSKTTAYFLRQSHGFNGVHGRMPALATGANAANRELMYIGDLGRRRFAVDRTRPALPRDSPQREYLVRAREQRRLRADQGAVLGVGRCRLEVEARRTERAAADRSRAARAQPRRDVRRAQLLGRQDAARADSQGGAARTTDSRSSTSSRRA